MAPTRELPGPVSAMLREHVLEPLSRTGGIIEAEREEVEAERRAFVRFRDRVADVETVTPSRCSTGSTLVAAPEQRSTKSLDRVRVAFRETVMSVDHYSEVYGEALEEFAAAELSPEVAVGLGPGTSQSFTDLYKATLMNAVDSAADRRETIRDHLDGERDAVATHRATLIEMLDSLDWPPRARRQSDIEDRLEEVTRARQTELHRGFPLSGADGHDLCQYLYQDPEWTYPVLTGVTRFYATLEAPSPDGRSTR
ncbi:DUF7260 family protein [Haloplanus salinarum]|uniref:DUF7260 family protein n=1 Tax=Haloplanus salinarum TaxID=1912324 RepID=UPI00214B92CD|nr:hypothetical protein [Haloplanus salinarum]